MEKPIKQISKTKKLSFFSKMLIGDEKNYFVENLSMLISSGMNVSSALEAIKTDLRSSVMKKIIGSAQLDIYSGHSIWVTLDKTNLLPAHVISLIRIGEKTGRLGKNLKLIVSQQQKERAFKSKIRSAMMYPVIVLMLTLVIGSGIAWFILPRLSSIFDRMRVELPPLTKAVIALGELLKTKGLIAVPTFLFGIIFICYFLFFFPKTKVIGQAFLIRLPGVSKLIKEVELASFGHSLGSMISAGLSIDYALDSISKTSSIATYKKMYAKLRDDVTEGKSFHKSISAYPKSSKKIPSPIQQMITSGEESGHLPEVLLKIGELFEDKIDTTSKNIAVILEPLLLIVVWIGVVLVALSIILPIYSLIGSVNKKTSTNTQQTSNQTPVKPANAPTVKDHQEVKVIGKVKVKINTEQSVLDKPSAKANTIKKISSGEVYQYSNTKNGWHEIILDTGSIGWVESKFLEPVK